MSRYQFAIQTSRRRFLGVSALGASAFFQTRGLFADELTRTPSQTEGPFYPDKLPLDTDNDLIRVNDDLTPAVGTITHLGGRVLDAQGQPLRNVLVEIWQVDGRGAYLHTKDPNHAQYDTNFQGFGRFLTGSSGEYYFRTVKPVPYPGRTPHIHVKLKRGDKDLLTTQCYIAGEPGNERDGVYRGLKDASERKAVTIGFDPLPGSALGELAARFDVVLGRTPEG